MGCQKWITTLKCDYKAIGVKGICMHSQNQKDEKTILMKYLIYYGLLYVISYLLITSLSSVFKVFIGYAAIPFLVAVFSAIQYIKNAEKPMNTFERVKFIFAAFKINSMPINTVTAFFLVTTANNPRQNKAALKIK